MAAGASGSLIEHPSSWRLLVEQYCDLVEGQPTDGVQRCTADFLVSNFRISNGYSVSVSIQTPVALDIAQDSDP
jgi:hypothetical protein